MISKELKQKDSKTTTYTITFEEFDKIINQARDYYDLEISINDSLRKVARKYNSDSSFMFPTMYDTTLSLLAIMMGDKGEWIDYFCWERDFGRDSNLGDVLDVDGSVIPLQNTRDLWNILTNEKLN